MFTMFLTIWLLSTSPTFSQDPPVTCYASVFFPFLNTKSPTSQAFPAMKLAVHLPMNCSSSPDLSLTKFFSSGSSLFKGHLRSRNSTVSDFHIHYLIFKSLMDVIYIYIYIYIYILAQQATIAKLPVRYVWTTVLMVVIGNWYGLNCVLSPKL